MEEENTDNNEMTSFTLYQLDSPGTNARCCY
jgi:hypothetical protein